MADEFAVALSLICDDARTEVGGKPFLIGVYAGTMVTTEIPVVLQTFCVYAEIKSPSKKEYAKVSALIRAPGGIEYRSAEGPSLFPYQQYNSPHFFKFGQVVFVEEGSYKIFIMMDSDPIFARAFDLVKTQNISTYQPPS